MQGGEKGLIPRESGLAPSDLALLLEQVAKANQQGASLPRRPGQAQ
jgi:hypothetical protein